MSLVHGKNVHLAIIEAGPLNCPIICATSCSIERTYDVIPVTTVSSGLGREFKTGRYEWNISLKGVTTTDAIGTNDKIIFDLLLEGGTKDIEMTFTDGTTAKTLSGTVIFPGLTIDGDVADFSTYTLELKGTGNLGLA